MNFDIDLDALLGNAKNVAIAGHIRPDGDCIGACLGMYLFIKEHYPAADVKVYLEEIPESFHFLAGAEQICHDADEQVTYDLFLILDCADMTRLGKNSAYMQQAKTTVCIDHHVTNRGFADHNLVRADASSTCEIICDLLGMDRISLQTAQALYTGIAHDTGVFQYTCTSPHTMEVAGALMAKGVEHTKIVQDTFFCRTYLQQQLLGRALLESVPVCGGKVIFSSLSLKTMRFFGASSKDLEGIAAILKNTFDVEASIFFYELRPMEWKVSLRSSEKVDVSGVAAAFAGGGHKQAAGCTIQGSRFDVLNNLIPPIADQLA